MPPNHSFPSSTIPNGWCFNPSEWSHRVRIIPLAILGFLVACYLALCQIGIIQTAWDPLFKSGTSQVLHSSVSKAFPIPDALLGAMVYAFEIFFLSLGPNDRWLTKPRLTIISGVTALILGMVSITLVFLQPVLIYNWCSWCLISALLMMIVLQRSFPELLACLQTQVLIKRNLHQFTQVKNERGKSQLLLEYWTQGTHCSWSLFASLILGIFTLALPDLFEIEKIGRLTIEFAAVSVIFTSFLAMCEPLYFLCWLNGVMGSLLLFWFLGQPIGLIRWITAGIGISLISLCVPRGKRSVSYGIFDDLINLIESGPTLAAVRSPECPNCSVEKQT